MSVSAWNFSESFLVDLHHLKNEIVGRLFFHTVDLGLILPVSISGISVPVPDRNPFVDFHCAGNLK